MEEKLSKLNIAYSEANDDSRFRNLSFCAAGNLSKGSRNYRDRHREKLCKLIDEITLCKRAVRIVKGETFTREDLDKCRIEIMHRYKEYERPFPLCESIAYMAESVVLSFWGKYKSVLNRYPVILDFEDNNGLYYYNPDKTIMHRWPELEKSW